eukprot:TRINITY_DN22712_c0_g1_i2.p1 TRINITY_DN22712_c0_g1~~TRINITY_DN22712_c0_g1_i2.p1  ORF type:complete len:796 (-),score=102.69 TRINITY_DN22712_c0_g1_i2:189-2576(-)
MAALMGFIAKNSVEVDASAAEKELREECPRLLEDDEHIVLAFKDRAGYGRDESFFTTARVLTKDVKAMSGKCVRYTSIPYDGIYAWSVDTAGMMDPDCSLRFWSKGVGLTKIDFVSGKVDVFRIMRHFNAHCLVEGKTGAHVSGGAEATIPAPTPPTACDKLLGFLGGDAHQLNPSEVQQELKETLNILMDDETVEMAFKAGRDSFIMTSKRILHIDVEGLTGKKVVYLSVLWTHIVMFSVETAGMLDTDAELLLFTDIPALPRIRQDLRKGKTDVMAIQKYIADKILGPDHASESEHAVPMKGHVDQGGGSIFAWMGNDSRMIDADEMNRQYHTNPPILQSSEQVEIAFKGRRDLILFTTKRLIHVDVEGFTRQKVNYVSIPWRCVQCFGVRSAGAWLDKDSEMYIWTSIDDVFFPPKDGDSTPPPIPRMSYLEFDFQKDKVDLMAIHRYLSQRCLPSNGIRPSDEPIDPTIYAPAGNVERFLNWLGQDARCVPASQIEEQLKSTNPMLQADEHVGIAYQVGRDTLIFTTKRVLVIDVQGWSGKKIEWKSIPYGALRAFSVTSAGHWDRDAEIKLFTRTYWINGKPSSVFHQDLRKGKCDIIAIQNYLSAQMFIYEDGTRHQPPPLETEPPEAPKGVEAFLNWIGNNSSEIDASTVDTNLHTSPPILQEDEKVEKAYKSGRDMVVHTTKRVLFIDVQGLFGKKVMYLTFPLRYCDAFYIQSAGHVNMGFTSSKFVVYTDVPGHPKIHHDLNEKRADIWDIQAHLSSKLIRRRHSPQPVCNAASVPISNGGYPSS